MNGGQPQALPQLYLGQGEVVWQPVRLPREEENLPELALGLRTIETFDAEPPRANEVHVQDFREVRLESLEIELDAEAPLDSSAVDSALASVTAEPTPAPPRGPIVAPPREPVPPRTPAPPPREARHAPLPDAPPQPVPTPVREPAIDPVPTAVGESALGVEPAAVGEPALDPESSSSRGAPGRPVEGNRSAFETWVRRLGSWEHR